MFKFQMAPKATSARERRRELTLCMHKNRYNNSSYVDLKCASKCVYYIYIHFALELYEFGSIANNTVYIFNVLKLVYRKHKLNNKAA